MSYTNSFDRYLNSSFKNMAPKFIFEIDTEGILLFSKGSILSYFGKKEIETSGKSAPQLFIDIPELNSSLKKALSGEEFSTILNTNSSILNICFTPAFDNNYKLIKIFVVGIDISEQNELVEKLKESESRLKKAESLAKVGNWELDIKNKRLTFSDEARRIFQIDDSDPFINVDTIKNKIYPEDLLRLSSEYFNSVKDKRITGGEYRIKSSNGETLYVESEWEIAFGENEKPVKMFGTFKDITEIIKKEKQILDSEHRYKQLFETMRDAFVSVDMSGKIISFNSAFEKMIGYSKDEIITLTYKDITPVKWHAYEQDIIEKQILSEGYSDTYEKEYIRKDGSIMPIDLRTYLIRDEQGNPNEMWAIIRDISNRKESEKKLYEANERFKQAFNAASIGKAIVSVEGKVLKTNETLCKIFGFTEEEFLEKSFYSITHPDDLEKVSYYFGKLLKKEISDCEFEKRYYNKNGKIIWALLHVSSVKDNNGKILYLVSQLVDLTKQKLIEQELREYQTKLEQIVEERTIKLKASEEKFRALAENTIDPIIRIDAQLRIVYANESVKKRGTVSTDGFLGKHIDDAGFSKSFSKQLIKYCRTINETRQNITFEYRSADGGWMNCLLFPEFNSDGEVTSYILSGRDITKLKEYEILVEDSLKKEKEINELKTSFISTVSHEFRTPLTSILFSTSILEKTSDNLSDEKKATHISRIKKNIHLMTDLMDEILLINKLESNRHELKIEQLNVSEICRNVLNETMEQYPQIKVNFIIPDEEVYCSLDSLLFEKIIQNIVTNAFKYNKANGSVEFEIKITGKKLLLKIKDEGIGIPKNEIVRLYEPFSRLSNSLKVKGTGLGLSIVKKAVDKLGGEILVKSKINAGTTFEIFIPINEG